MSIEVKKFDKFQIFSIRDFATLIGLALMCIVISILSPVFLTANNLINVVMQSSINAIIAIGLTFVILTGGIDLSVGSIVALAGVIMASSLQAGHPLPVSLVIALVIGVLCGYINGFLITKGKLPPFIATLGMMSIARGLALVYTNGRPISGFSPAFRWFGTGTFLGIPSQIIMTVILYAIAYYILKYTRLGRYTYAIGGNEEATRLSGINVNRYKVVIYSISGLMAAIGSIVLTARLNSAQPIAGINYELDAIAATVIGGTSTVGGEGKITGTLIGALIMGVLRNGLNILNVSSYLQQVIIGAVIVIAVLIDKYRK
ncbi:MAG: ribose transport system permease protein [Petroclostridium sp.]|jgi:ribose transport system permease protein|uniref:ABC transporter permease n=1 Tax=Petroclostridium xylanilyticum TaxID=1792311 RepID=UPI000B9933C0|nr:ribose ABC transporter permease [Petroclostridium xylanilyticum]MBZ4645516.1 rbsC [Clostridia bacterium]MDK2810849.1 ribose transport system permease protein [Petroclostridium sp.]